MPILGQQASDAGVDSKQDFSYGSHYYYSSSCFIRTENSSYFAFVDSKFVIELMKQVRSMADPE